MSERSIIEIDADLCDALAELEKDLRYWGYIK